MGLYSVDNSKRSHPDTNNNDSKNNNKYAELSTKPISILASYNSSNSTVPTDRINNERFLVNIVHLLNFLFKSSTIFRAGQGAGNFVEIEVCPILLVADCLPAKKK